MISSEIYILSAKRKGKGNQIQILLPINGVNKKLQTAPKNKQYRIIGMIKMDRLHSFVKSGGVGEFNHIMLDHRVLSLKLCWL